MEQLDALQLEYEEVGTSGIRVLIRGKEEGKTILLRADMDALPMQEENDLPFKATGQCAHTCGHDLHDAMLLGAAEIINNHKDEFAGNVKLMFQPAEEIFKGSEENDCKWDLRKSKGRCGDCLSYWIGRYARFFRILPREHVYLQ